MRNNYTKKEIEQILQNEIEIPQEVEMKMEKAFRQIGATEAQKARKRRSLRFQVALVLAGAMILGTVTVGATGFFFWNQDVAERFEADEEKQQILEEKKVTVPIEASATDQGVTVSLEQSLMTEKDMYLYFKIEVPEEIPADMDILFDWDDILIDGKSTMDYDFSWCGGQPMDMEREQSNIIYQEYFVQAPDIMDFNGKVFTAHFENLKGYVKNEAVQTIAEGTWDVSWVLDYAPSQETFTVDQEIPEENITVKRISISPISMEVVYDWEGTFHESEIIDENGNAIITEEEDFAPIYPAQYRLEDGSLVEINKDGMGARGRNQENLYLESWQSAKVNIVEDITGVVFKSWESEDTEKSYEINIR